MKMVSALCFVLLLAVMLSCAPSSAQASSLLLVAAEAVTATPQPCLQWIPPSTPIGLNVDAEVQVSSPVAEAMNAGQVKVFFFQANRKTRNLFYCQGVQQAHDGNGLVSQQLTLGNPNNPAGAIGQTFDVRIIVSRDSTAFDCAGGSTYSAAELPSPDTTLCPTPLTISIVRTN